MGDAVRYKIFIQVTVDASGEEQAAQWARKIEKLLKDPMARWAIDREGIRVVGEPVALQPRQE